VIATAIELENVSKAFSLPHQRQSSIKEMFLHPLRKVEYEWNQALDDVSLSVEHGECFGIIGPNGGGKSTLLKILAGIYRADRGTVRVDGRLSPFIELGVGFNSDLNARENIRINGTLLGLSLKELAERFDEIVAFAELERFVDQKLKNYSSGMHVRLAFSIAIQVPFDILLLDEVLAVGDQAFQEKCYRTFEQMRRDGKTIVFVSHDLASVARFCDRAVLLRQGRIEAAGPALDVVQGYRTAVAEPVVA
jgi:ABC-type polysaccharide/polyol phosphate transport system ATPase subunit